MSIVSHDPATFYPDFSGWLQVSRPSQQHPPYLSATTSGHIYLNDTLQKEMKAASSPLTFRFLLQPDGKALALLPKNDGPYRFPKGGRIKDYDFTRHLVSLNIPLPARYRMAWNEACTGWVGVLEESACQNALQTSLSRGRPRKERRA